MLHERLVDASCRAWTESAVLIRIEAFDWNCPLHIAPRFTTQEFDAAVEPLRARIRELEQKLGYQDR
jgi:hypothetical protein